MRIKVKDIYDGVGGFGQGTTILFEVRDEKDSSIVYPRVLETVRRESWFTQNSGGVDYYVHDTGEIWPIEDDDTRELLEDFFEEVNTEYQKAWKEFVNPAIGHAVECAIAASEAMGEEPRFDSLRVDM